MVYWLVNNNYHVVDVLNHLPGLSQFEHGLIGVPHTLDLDRWSERFDEIFNFPCFEIGLKDLLPWRLRGRKDYISSKICPTNDDVLFAYSELDVINLVVIMRFKDMGARVFLVEEGVATYLELCFLNVSEVSYRRRLSTSYLAWVLRLPLKATGSETLAHFVLDDRTYDGALLYHPIEAARKIRSYHVKHHNTLITNLDESSIIHLNEDTYNFYESYSEYERALVQILEQLKSKFSTVYFKYHPRELRMSPDKVESINVVINRIGGIQVIECQDPVEVIVERYLPKYVSSYISVGLMNLFMKGLEPFYLYSLFPDLAKQSNIVMVKRYLSLLGYQPLVSLDQVRPGYRSGLLSSDLGIEWNFLLSDRTS